MAKDPAFLFYPGDWLGGTMLLTRHQKGCYIDLLMAQFNSGPLSLDAIKTVLGQDQAVWTVLQVKFKQDPKGLYYNEKLATEIEKRKNYVSSRSNNKSGRKSYDKSYDNQLNNRMENEDENEIRDEIKGGAGGKEIVPQMQAIFKKHNPGYGSNRERDFPPLLSIAQYIAEQIGSGPPQTNVSPVLAEWEIVSKDLGKAVNFYHGKTLKSVSTHIQEIYQKAKNGTHQSTSGNSTKGLGNKSAGFGHLTNALNQTTTGKPADS